MIVLMVARHVRGARRRGAGQLARALHPPDHRRRLRGVVLGFLDLHETDTRPGARDRRRRRRPDGAVLRPVRRQAAARAGSSSSRRSHTATATFGGPPPPSPSPRSRRSPRRRRSGSTSTRRRTPRRSRPACASSTSSRSPGCSTTRPTPNSASASWRSSSMRALAVFFALLATLAGAYAGFYVMRELGPDDLTGQFGRGDAATRAAATSLQSRELRPRRRRRSSASSAPTAGSSSLSVEPLRGRRDRARVDDRLVRVQVDAAGRSQQRDVGDAAPSAGTMPVAKLDPKAVDRITKAATQGDRLARREPHALRRQARVEGRHAARRARQLRREPQRPGPAPLGRAEPRAGRRRARTR